MANFNTHFVVGAIATSILSGTLLSMEILSPNEAVLAFVLGTFGSLIPDIDADNSKSIGIAFTVVSLLVTTLAVFVKSATYSLVEMLLMAGVVFYLIRFGFIGLFRKVSKHRGMFHSIPVALIWGVATAIIMHLFFDLNALLSWSYGLMITWGYLVHLLLDEIYSVDLGNRRVKKSFGTALKFFRLKTTTDKIQNLIIYASLGWLISISPDTSLIKEALFSPEAWANFKDILLPYDGRWFFH
jgi:membrane-bound metal-dependent hydrolase YbcI (DUF457 family)